MYEIKFHDKHPECGVNTTTQGCRDGFELNLMYLHQTGNPLQGNPPLVCLNPTPGPSQALNTSLSKECLND